MDDFAPPAGPPPPKVPDGWRAQWNDQYSEWFYVNTYTKRSQWDKPTEPIYPTSDHVAPPGAPPGYVGGAGAQNLGAEKGSLSSNNPYGAAPYGAGAAMAAHHDTTEADERLARKLQAEEDERAAGAANRGTSENYYAGPPGGNQPGYGQPGYVAPGGYGQQMLPPREQEKSGGAKGFLGKLLGKGHQQQQPAQAQQYGGGYGQQGSYPQPYPNQGAYAQQQYGGYQQQPQYMQQQQRRQGGGMGAMGGAALGLGGGLLGGMMLENAIGDHDNNDNNNNYNDNGGGSDGGDYGGGDGGGDMGGGGGDF